MIDKNYTLLDVKIINDYTDIQYICCCGTTYTKRIERLAANDNGCYKCNSLQKSKRKLEILLNQLLNKDEIPLNLALWALRLEHNKTVSEVSKVIGVSTETIYCYENGKHIPSEKNIEILSAYYNINKDIYFKDVIKNNKVKKCNDCQESFPATTEYYFKKGRNGLESNCKTCKSKKNYKYKGVLPHYMEGQEISNEDTLLIYKAILAGTIDRFIPNPQYTKENFAYCYRYLIKEILKWDRELLLRKMSSSIVRKYKLVGTTKGSYFGGYINALIEAFPEWNLKAWEFLNVGNNFWNDQTFEEAIRWTIGQMKKEGLIRELPDITAIATNDMLESYGLRTVIEKFEDSYIKMLQWYFYKFTDYRPKVWEYRKLPNGFWNDEENFRKAVRDKFQKAGFDGSLEWIKKNVNREFLKETNLQTALAKQGNNIYKLVKFTYPEIENSEDLFIKHKASDGTVLDSRGELLIYERFAQDEETTIMYTGRKKDLKFYNELYDERYIPDFIITDFQEKKLINPLIIEYFGLYDENKTKYKYMVDYVNKTKRKIEYFNKHDDFMFVPIFPGEINNLEKIVDKVQDKLHNINL